MVRDEVVAQLLERLGRCVRTLQEIDILIRNRAPFGHRLERQHLIPEVTAVQDDGDLLRELVGLREREDLEELVARAEPPGKNDERLRQVREPELPHEEVVELELKA